MSARGLAIRWVLLAAPFVLGPGEAVAFRLETNSTGATQHWSATNIPYVIGVDRARVGQSSGKWIEAMRGGVEAWTWPTRSPIRLEYRGARDATFLSGDGVTSLVLLEDGPWPPALGDPLSTAAATLLLGQADGEITEADVAANGGAFFWSPGRPSANKLNLRGVILHELGHVLGLAHPCGDVGLSGCDALGGRSLDSVMIPAATPGDSSNAGLGQDDLDGLNALYGEGSSVSPDGSLFSDCANGVLYQPGPSGEALREVIAWPREGGAPLRLELKQGVDRQRIRFNGQSSGKYDLDLLGVGGGTRSLFDLSLAPAESCRVSSEGCAQGGPPSAGAGLALSLFLVAFTLRRPQRSAALRTVTASGATQSKPSEGHRSGIG